MWWHRKRASQKEEEKSMFCKNCGAENYDGARFCVGCGADLTPAPAQPVYEQPVYEQPVYEQPVQQAPANAGFEQTFNNVKDGAADAFNKAADFGKNYVEAAKKDKKKMVIGIAAIVAVLAIIIGLFSVLGGGYRTALNNYYKKYLIGKATKTTIKNMYPKQYWEENDIDPDDMYENYEEYYKEYAVESLEDEYGKNLRVSYKITDKDKLDKDDLKELREELSESWGIKKKDVKKAYELELDITIRGSEDKDTDEATVIVAKIGSKWYIVQ